MNPPSTTTKDCWVYNPAQLGNAMWARGTPSSGKPGDFSGVVCGGNGGMFSGCSPGYAKSKAPSSQVRTQHFFVRPRKRGEIKSMKHLFGDDEKRNGFESLKAYDTNNDGILDKKDKNFSELKLWFDRNISGKVDKGEVVSLKEKGVEKINLNYLSLGEPESAEGKTLSFTYYNTKLKKDLSIEDHYFYQYIDSKRVEFEKKPD